MPQDLKGKFLMGGDKTQDYFGRRRLYLMRHGHVDYFAPGLTDFRTVSLTERGHEQAKAAAKALSGVHLDLVCTSGLPRTIQTAEHILELNDHSDHEVISIEAFEELRGGKVVVPTREELAARLAFSFDLATEKGASFLPDGELFAEAYDRVRAGLAELVSDHTWRSALLVGHDGVNRLILGWACGAGLEGIKHFEQDLACINVLDFDVAPDEQGKPEILRTIIKAINITAYDVVKSDLRRTSLEHLFDIDFGGARPV